MNMGQAVDAFIADMKLAGRINSERTVTHYQHVLWAHAEDVSNRSPHTTNRNDVKQTLTRWPHANTQRTCRSVLVSFYRWCVEEGIRPNNPAEQTRRPKKKPSAVYRLTKDEMERMLAATQGVIEHRAIALGLLTGLRSSELRGLQGPHFRRAGFVHVTADIAKGQRERWVPVHPVFACTFREIAGNVADDEFVLPAQRWRDPGRNQQRVSLTRRPMSPQGLYYLVGRVGKRAGIAAPVHPHLLRHAYGDHIAKHAGLLVAQALMGHATVATTRDTYVDQMSLDELADAIASLSLGYPLANTPVSLEEATTGIEPVSMAERLPKGVADYIERIVPIYAAHFTGASA